MSAAFKFSLHRKRAAVKPEVEQTAMRSLKKFEEREAELTRLRQAKAAADVSSVLTADK